MNARYALYPLCAVLFILAALLIFEKQADKVLSIPYTYSPNNSENLPSSLKELQLHDTTLFWEVIAQHTQSSKGITAANETLSAGVCVFDANNDGWMDLFVVGGSGFSRNYGKKSWWASTGGNRLLINDNGLRFVDLTEESGLQQRQWSTSCAIADLDLDGLQDIIITGFGENRLFKQTNELKFVDVTDSSGVLSDNWSTGAAIGDFDNDGRADIYITNLVQFEKGKRTFEQDSGFESSIPENFSPALYDPEPNRLYRNLGNMQFKSVEKDLKIDNIFGRSLFAKWHDFNEDNWLDLIVINDFNSPNQIYLNKSGKEFVPAQERFSTFHLSGSRDMAIIQSAGGQQLDDPAYFFSRSAGQANVFLRKASVDSVGYADQARNVNLASNLRMSSNNWGVIAVDVNNDGFQDIYQTSGSLLPDQESKFVTQRQSNNLYIGNPGGFSANSLSQFSHQPVFSSRAVASADLNNDGQLELIIANNNGPLQILSRKSISTGSWLGIQMDNGDQNYSPNQAKIEVRSGDRYIDYTLDYKQSLFAQSDPRMHLGLGDLQSNVDLKISWPDGQVAEFPDITISNYYRVNKSTGDIKKNVYATESSNNKLIVLSNNASQQDIKLLMEIAFYSDDKKALNSLWYKADQVNRIKLLDLITKDTNIQNQAWLFSALQDSDVQVVLTALGIFKQKEWDHSVIYLLPLFEHKNEQVVCAIADIFRFFFDEEEAVPERKGLAVAPIMRALESTSNSSKKVCLLNALAASENKRAVLSVIDTLNRSADPQVQGTAIKALGLIRDARANKEIKRVLQSTQSPKVVSASLIALKRLNDLDHSEIFKRTFDAKPNDADLIRQLETINLLLTDGDGVVISRPLTISALTKLTEFIADFGSASSVSIALLKTIGNSKDKRFRKIPETFLANLNTRNQAAIALLKIGDTAGQQKAKNILLKLSNLDLLIVLKKMEKQNVSLPLDISRELAGRSIKDKPLLESILSLGYKIGRENYQRWLVEVIKQTGDTKILVSAFDSAIHFAINGQLNLQEMQWSSNPEIASHYLKWQYIQSSDYSTNQLLKLRLLLNRLLRGSQLSVEARQSLLLTAAKHDPFVANNFLINNQFGLTELQIAAIHVENPSLKLTKEQIALFERMLDNQSLHIHDRLVAATRLLSNDPNRKHEILIKL